jgi:hypothetical protein
MAELTVAAADEAPSAVETVETVVDASFWDVHAALPPNL